MGEAKYMVGWPANHVFGFPHPFWEYIIGIGISLNVFSSIFYPFSLKQVPKIQGRVFFEKTKSSRQGCAANIVSELVLKKKENQCLGPTNWAN